MEHFKFTANDLVMIFLIKKKTHNVALNSYTFIFALSRLRKTDCINLLLKFNYFLQLQFSKQFWDFSSHFDSKRQPDSSG